MINELKKYAEDNYAKGFDVFVECYDDDEWNASLVERRNPEEGRRVA